MSSKEQLCMVCGSWISYPKEDMVRLRIKDDPQSEFQGGNAHLECAWSTKDNK